MTDTAATEPANLVSVARRIPAPAAQIFAVLADPARHPEIDGSGMVRGALDPRPLGGVGDEFAMSMHNDEMGDYEMTNRVVEYEQGRRLVWAPVLTGAARPEVAAGVGEDAHHRWGYTLVPDDDGTTLVTETYDCTESPEWLKKAVRGGRRWTESMTVSLERLESVSGSTHEQA